MRLSHYLVYLAMLPLNFVILVSSASAISYPDIQRKQGELVLPLENISDSYQWLENYNSEVASLLQAENHYTDIFLASEKALQERLLEEMKERLSKRVNIQTWQDSNRIYRQTYTGRYPIIERQRADKSWQLIIDGNQRAGQFPYYLLHKPVISPNQHLALIIEDTSGDEQYQLSLLDIETGQIQQELSNILPDAVWRKDNLAIYYLAKDSQQKISLYLHYLGHNQQQDTLIYQESDNSFLADITLSSSGRYLILSMNNATQSEVRVLDLNQEKSELQLVKGRQEALEYYVDHSDDGFYIRSNWQQDNTLKTREFTLFYATELKSAWQSIFVPQMASELESFTVLKNWVLVRLRKNGVVQYIYWNKRKPEQKYNITFPEENYLVRLQGINDDNHITFTYSSVSTPTTLLEFDLIKGQFSQTIQKMVQGYTTKYLKIVVRDGTLVPVTLVYKTGLFLKGKNPLLITGYGAYGFSFEATYGTSYLSLLDRGFVLAIAHVRGGGELGAKWYKFGKGIHKQNSINDFIDVTEYLQQNGYSAEHRTYAMGESAGGLLIAAAVNQNPSLYRAVVLQVPYLDLLSNLATEVDEKSQEVQEWGSIYKPTEYQIIKSYSPYQNIRSQRYPAMLLTAGFNDNRVPYWQSVKFAASVRHQQVQNEISPILVRIENASGHHSGNGRLGRILRNVEAYSFLLKIDRTLSTE
ncbi:prolyl oligopeptidase family serine peptidase [Avibacterium sp. 21-586]|uniref:prolyl oligopeptidase family serine peptidase n=1 Tax=Avibacterium sp. 21-586 TaxID=2911534 RepID=UPI00224737E9|nr:prolyl oligopeptidase family serine peptidase [Avibacterium sp. 21-586]MCW9710292.1 prolyl oligopeptidase family serine peptidase [Avibacterium sp. 21-586]